MSVNGNKEASLTDNKDSLYINHDAVSDENIQDDAFIYCNIETKKDLVDDLQKIIHDKKMKNGFETDFQVDFNTCVFFLCHSAFLVLLFFSIYQ